MPRGTRAIMKVRGDTLSRESMLMIYADVDWLWTTCWCEHEFVLISQRDVLDGLTASCGNPVCIGPKEARYAITGSYIANGGNALPLTMQYLNRLYNLPKVERERPKLRRVSRPRRTSELVTARRDMVKALWEQGLSHMAIAERLDKPFSTINMDILTLQRQGIIPKAKDMPNRPKRGRPHQRPVTVGLPSEPSKAEQAKQAKVQAVEQRRRAVEILWNQGLRAKPIAERLGIAFGDAIADVIWLQKTGKLIAPKEDSDAEIHDG